jgi:hypothetical protein
MLLFDSTLLKHSCNFYQWNQPLNMHIYQDYHKARLPENLLCLLHLFYFHLWPIYWLSLVHLLFNKKTILTFITFKAIKLANASQEGWLYAAI